MFNQAEKFSRLRATGVYYDAVRRTRKKATSEFFAALLESHPSAERWMTAVGSSAIVLFLRNLGGRQVHPEPPDGAPDPLRDLA